MPFCLRYENQNTPQNKRDYLCYPVDKNRSFGLNKFFEEDVACDNYHTDNPRDYNPLQVVNFLFENADDLFIDVFVSDF